MKHPLAPRDVPLPALLTILCALALPAASAAAGLDRESNLYEVLEWAVDAVEYTGNPFEEAASVTFTHAESGETRRTGMFYDEDNTWRFRFTGVRSGAWTFVSQSGNARLDGISGTVTVNPDPAARGFLRVSGSEIAVPVGSEDNLKPFLFHVYMDEFNYRTNGVYGDGLIDWLPNVEARMRAYCIAAREQGFNVVFINPHVQWFGLGATRSTDFRTSDPNPDPRTFRVVESMIRTAREEGLHLHFWLWGDEDRHWTQILLGGINGVPDKRLLRYMAARLGPMPGWSVGYGFDLFEWVQPGQVAAWADYFRAQKGWNSLLMAREEAGFSTPANMDVYSTDRRFTANWYSTGLIDLHHPGNRPVLYSRRWLFQRDGYDMDATRRSLWQFTMAAGSGVAGWYGPPWSSAGSYPHPEQLATYGRFWHNRLELGMLRDNPRNQSGGVSFALRNADNTLFFFYTENRSSMTIDLYGASGPMRAVAINTKDAYAEIDLGELGGGTHTFDLGTLSDWAITVSAESPTAPGEWAGFPLTDGWADTGGFMGFVHPVGDYVYVWSLRSWLYLPEEHVGGAGAWAFWLRQ